MVSPKVTAAIILGSIASWFSEVWVFIALTLIAMMLDYVSGILAGRANEGLNSQKALKGLYKKSGIFILLCLGLFLDGTVNSFMMDSVEFFHAPFTVPIAHIVTMWIIVTEAISICENLERVGVPIPKWMIKMLRKTQQKMDDDSSGK